MPKFIKLTCIWSGEFFLNSSDIHLLTYSKVSCSSGQANTYVVCATVNYNVTETIDEIMEMLNGE